VRLSKKFAAIAIASTVAVTGTAAFAFFTATGSGNGTATVGTSSPWTVSTGVTTGNALLPGSGSQSVAYTVTNASAGGQSVGSVIVSVVGTTNCPASNFAVNNAGNSTALGAYTGAQVKPGSAVVTMLETGLNQDLCKSTSPALLISVS
jgi:hypothetical protein